MLQFMSKNRILLKGFNGHVIYKSDFIQREKSLCDIQAKWCDAYIRTRLVISVMP